MARGQRDFDHAPLALRRRTVRPGGTPAPRPDLDPFRLWVSGVLCVVPDALGQPRIAHDFDGTRSEAWAESGMLPVPLPLPPDGAALFWQAPPGWSSPPDAFHLFGSQLGIIVEQQAALVWGGNPAPGGGVV